MNVLRDIENLTRGMRNFEHTPKEPKNGDGGQNPILDSDLESGAELKIEPSSERSGVNIPQYFIPSKYKDASGKSNVEYLLTRDGFSLLVMGFTGAKALEWKLKYIQAFNAMEKRLNDDEELSPLLKVLINLERNQNKVQRELTEVSQRLDNMGDVIRLNREFDKEALGGLSVGRFFIYIFP